MYKYLISILFFVAFLPTVFGADLKPKIDNFNYVGSLSNNSIININGSNLDDCSELYVGNEKVKIFDKNGTTIQYKFSENNIYYGKIKLICGTENELVNYFSFPYIKKINYGNSILDIDILGENFGFNSNVVIEGGKFNKSISQNSIIVGELSNDISGNKLYVEVNGLRSNEVELDLKIPKINFIYSDNYFFKGSKITIFGENLNSYGSSKILFGDLESTNYTYNKEDGSISFISSSDLGFKKIKVKSSEFISNGVDININGENPVLNSIIESRIKLIENGTEIIKDGYIIKGQNIPSDPNDIIFYINGVPLNIVDIKNNEIKAVEYNKSSGDIFIHAEVNGVKSNTLTLKIDSILPTIDSIDIGGIEGDKRSVKIYLSNFNNDLSEIYFNKLLIEPEGCNSGMCRVLIPASELIGEFIVGNGITKNIKGKKINLEYDKSPFVEKFNFKGNIVPYGKFEIEGKNFSDSQITVSNLTNRKDNGQPDLSISDGLISGSLGKDYNINEQSEIIIQKGGFTYRINFIGNEILTKKFKSVGFIDKINAINDNGLITAGSTIKISGKGFNEGNNLIIGKIKVPLTIVDSNNAVFNIPNTVQPGIYEIYLENEFGSKGNKIELLILENWHSGNISINSMQIPVKNFKTQSINGESIYSLEIDNRINDVYLNNINFKIDNYNKELMLGTFDLSINGIIYGTSHINDEGIISFDGFYPLLKNAGKINLNLIKKSEYIKSGNFKINLDSNSIVLKNYINDKVVSNVSDMYFYPNTITIVTDGLINCIDSVEDNLNCNRYLSNKNFYTKPEINNNTETINKTETKVTETKKTETTVSKAQQVYNRIDNISENLISKNDKYSLYDQLNKYKDLRFKINKVIKNKQNSPSKVFLEYFYTKIDKKYKTVFKAYILSKK